MMTAAMCLALNMYFEARDQGITGMLMVAEVTMNRVADSRFPDTVCEVVWQRKQFSWTHDGLSDTPDTSTHHNALAWRNAQALAEGILKGTEAMLGLEATHYHATYVEPSWAQALEKVGEHGDHVFYVWRKP